MRVLTIDGMSAAALQIRLIKSYEEACPGFLRSVDCFAGASDGGYTALFLAAHVSDNDAANLAMLDRAIAFSNALVPLFRLTPGKGLKFATGWWPLLYLKEFRDVFEQYLGNRTIADVKPKMIIASYGAFAWEPFVFSNLPQNGRGTIPRRGQDSTRLSEVAHATSALPLALPMYGKGLDRMVDGGFVANNTSMLAVSEVCGAVSEDQGTDPSVVLQSLRVLSLGATDSFKERSDTIKVPCWPFKGLWERNAWGYKQWLLRRPSLLMEMLLQGSIDLAHHQVAGLLPKDRYHRIQPPMAEMGDAWRLLLGCPKKTIERFDREAERLSNTLPWFDHQVAWIRDHYLADDT